ncbi:YceD family protein [Extensimonas vulgaris]|nr:YceD family protein [Extensimonas vulgaris]
MEKPKTKPMDKEGEKTFSADRLDVWAFAQAGGQLAGRDQLPKYERLTLDTQGLRPDLFVDWQAEGSVRKAALGGVAQAWLQLRVHATVPLLCQRCLTPVDVPLVVERAFRFVADEATAEALDEGCEEDLLVLSRSFDLRALIEDELILALPLVPMHDRCPVAVPMASSDPDFDAAGADKPHPFAALAGLRKDQHGK